MKKWLDIFVLVLCVFMLAGCLDCKTVVKVKADGSGTIEQTVLMSKMAVQQIKLMMQMGAPDGEGVPEGFIKGFEIFDEAKLKREAENMGEGVVYVSGKKVDTKNKEGYVAVYSFKDINKVKVQPGLENKMPAGPMPMPEQPAESFTFSFKKEKSLSHLTVLMPSAKEPSSSVQDPQEIEGKEEGGEEGGESPDQPDMPGSAEMARTMMQDMKISFVIEVEGTIVKSNATHRKGAQVTIMEVDFGSFAKDEKKFEQFQKKQPKTIQEAQELMKGIPGIKLEIHDQVEIKFKK